MAFRENDCIISVQKNVDVPKMLYTCMRFREKDYLICVKKNVDVPNMLIPSRPPHVTSLTTEVQPKEGRGACKPLLVHTNGPCDYLS